jgi:protein N-terminal glutamine amidohydrolase
MFRPDYTPYYCEENIWRLCRASPLRNRRASVVFVSNPARSCALWEQRASEMSWAPVIWDYHVVLLTYESDENLIWDPDCLAGFPITISQWWSRTFPYCGQLVASLEPEFRVVERTKYLEQFYSDRRHMRTELGEYIQPPPAWDPIRGHLGSNLARFSDTRDAGFIGLLFTAEEWQTTFILEPGEPSERL